MTDNSRAKSHLNTVEAILSTRNSTSIDSVVTYNSMKLYENLSNQNLFVDGDIVQKLQKIHSKLNDRTSGSLYGDIQARIVDLNTEKSATGTSRRRVTEINAEISELNARLSNITTRAGEYLNLHNCANNFNLTPTAILPNLDINTGPTPVTGTTRISLANFLNPGLTFLTDNDYKLCNEDGSEIPITLGTPPEFSFKTSIGGQEYTIKKVKFSGGNLDFSNMEISPDLKSSPVEVPLSINAVFNPTATGVPDVNVVCNKKFKLKLNNGIPTLNTETSRETAFQDYEDSGGRHAISEQLNTKINVRHSDSEIGKNILEREALESALKYKGGTKFGTLTEKQKRLFYERIYRLGIFDSVYAAGGVIDTGNARYEKMKTWFTRNDRPRNKDNNIIKSPADYKTYIHSHLDEKCDEYILTTLKNYLQDDAKNTELKSELSKFLQEIDQNKVDTSVNASIYTALTRGNYKMKKGPRSPLRPRDVNYMRFFSNSSASLKRQQVNIYSNLDNPEPVNYDMDLNITGKNNIEVQLKIDGTDEIIKQKAGQPSTLVRKIMRDQRIKHGKVRAHIGFNIYKSIIQIAQEKNISLTYRGMEGKMGGFGSRKSYETRKIILDKNGNIVIKQINHLTTTNTEKDIFVFDQNSFLNVNEFDTGQTNGILRNGIELLGQHFNIAMNHLHKQYRKGIGKKFGNLIHSRNRMKLPTSFWLSPIKKILNCKTTTNFDFDTTVNAGGKNIGINFRKNKFTISMDGLKKPLKGRDLGRLLNHREGRVRVFDGIERDIVEGVYSTLIDNLRKNAKIARTNFGVVDDITGNMYVLDEDGKFGVIAREDFKGKNKIKNPLRGRFRKRKKKGSLNKKRFDDVSRRPLEQSEQKELLKNPFLMQRFVKAMNRRMGLGGSISALFN